MSSSHRPLTAIYSIILSAPAHCLRLTAAAAASSPYRGPAAFIMYAPYNAYGCVEHAAYKSSVGAEWASSWSQALPLNTW